MKKSIQMHIFLLKIKHIYSRNQMLRLKNKNVNIFQIAIFGVPIHTLLSRINPSTGASQCVRVCGLVVPSCFKKI